MKIVYSTNTIYKLGGIEIVTVVKANALAAIPGNQVWIAVADNRAASIISLKNVSVIDLALYLDDDHYCGYCHSIINLWKKRRLHRRRLEQLLNEINPDVVISTGMADKQFIPKMKIKSNPVFIMELHSSRHYGLEQAQGWCNRMFAKIAEMYNDFIYNKYDKIVVLTEAERTGAWAESDRVTVIPNPITRQEKEQSECTAKIVITAARLIWIKNHESLINIWAKVIQRHPDWTLQIWGEGPEKKRLEEQIRRIGLREKVYLMGYTPDIQKKMAEASIFVLTSRTEGFSLSALEAMSVGIPTVAYNCPGGLRYVLEDGETGFVVPMNDEETFVEKVCTLIENEELRKVMGQAALKEAARYKIDAIVQKWMTLFYELLIEKRNQK